MYVLKFRGADQGTKALIAELIAGEIASATGLLVPELILVSLDPEIAKTEPNMDQRSKDPFHLIKLRRLFVPDKFRYDYAVVRVVPKVDRQEFINAGVISLVSRFVFFGSAYQVE